MLSGSVRPLPPARATGRRGRQRSGERAEKQRTLGPLPIPLPLSDARPGEQAGGTRARRASPRVGSYCLAQPLRSAWGNSPVSRGARSFSGTGRGRAVRAVIRAKGLLFPRPLRLSPRGMGTLLLLSALGALLCSAAAGEARGARSCAETRQALASRGFSLASVPPTLISGKGARPENLSEGGAIKVSWASLTDVPGCVWWRGRRAAAI